LRFTENERENEAPVENLPRLRGPWATSLAGLRSPANKLNHERNKKQTTTMEIAVLKQAIVQSVRKRAQKQQRQQQYH
jgi:hypothetical protein